MSDELECFRLAAELGCPDFKTSGPNGLVWFRCLSFHLLPECEPFTPPESRQRINRYAADVCAGWWQRQYLKYPQDADDDLADDCQRMLDLCKAFGKKYGGAK